MSERRTSEWPALLRVWDRKKKMIEDREKEHAQHVIDHGAPRTKPEVWLAALLVMKANRIWNNLLRGGTRAALEDSAFDLAVYADFLVALFDEQNEEALKTKKLPWDRPIASAPGPQFNIEVKADNGFLQTVNVEGMCYVCGGPAAMWTLYDAQGRRDYCGPHFPIIHT